MNSRLLLAIFDSLYVIALTAWVGAILFFSFGVAPIIFRVLGAEAAARFVRASVPAILRLGGRRDGDRLAGPDLRVAGLPRASWAERSAFRRR